MRYGERMIGKELELTIQATIREAKSLRHEYLTVEHILYAIIHDEWGIDIITNCDGNVLRIKASLDDYFQKHVPKIPGSDEVHPQPTGHFSGWFSGRSCMYSLRKRLRSIRAICLHRFFLRMIRMRCMSSTGGRDAAGCAEFHIARHLEDTA